MENIMSRSVRSEYLILFTMYLIAHGLMLTCNGIFWDDWTLYDVKSDAIIDVFRQAGMIWVGYIHVFMLSLPKSIFCYRLLVFLSFMFSGFFLNAILKRITGIDNFSRLMIVILFLIFPVNSARVALINAPSALCYFSFFSAFWIIAVFPGKIFLRILAAGLFLFSFTINSLLVYYSLVLVFLFYRKFSFRFSVAHIKQYLLKNIDLILLPVLFWTIKSLFLSPYGLYENSNTILAESIYQSPQNFYHIVLESSFLDVIRSSLAFLENLPVILLCMTLLLSIVLIRLKYVYVEGSTRKHLVGIFAGLLVFFLGVFPYLAVRKTPYLHDWLSRFQLLVPLGAALIICNALGFLLRRKVLVIVFSFFAAIFLLTDMSIYLDYQKDWYKQLSLVENFKDSEVIRHNSTFLMCDETPDLNVNGRVYRFYEYTGLMKKAFEDQTRLGEIYYRQEYDSYSQFILDNYNMADYVWKDPEYRVIIKYGTYGMSLYNVLKLRFCELLDDDAFLSYTKEILSVHCVEITNH